MRYNTTINNVKAKKWKLNIQQAYLFAWLYELPSWAEKVIIEGETYYFASKTKAVTELPILTEKRDTMYRYYKQLQEKDLIEIKKIDGKDYINITPVGKEWNGTKSDTSENNPSRVGNISELPSDLNPTYNNTIYDNITIYNKAEFFEDWNELRKEHLNKTSFLNHLSPEENNNLHDLAKAYTRENFREALIGLFKQKKMPNGNTTMQSNPKHFLSHFNAYLTAYHDQNNSLYGKQQIEKTL